MELKTKYQYTYFIYPYLIEEKNYQKYLYKLLKNKNCRLKMFDQTKDTKIDSYFLPEIKNKMFWSLGMSNQNLKSYNAMDKKMQSLVLSHKYCNIFEYILNKDVQGKIGEKDGIFFDINKVEIVCYNTGVCFVLIKTVLNTGSNFRDVLNFNYKFRDIQSKIKNDKEFENIKIQTQKFDNMQKFSDFLTQIVGKNILAPKINLDTNRLITYAYTCLENDSWNETTDLLNLEKQFEKYRTVKPSNEHINNTTLQKENIYKQKYMYYGFTPNSTVLLTSGKNIQNYNKILFEYENVQLYHYLYYLHQKIYLKKIDYEIKNATNFENIKNKFIQFAKNDWICDITNNTMGVKLEKYFKKELNLNEAFSQIKIKHDLLYKDYKINKNNKKNNWIIAIIGAVIAVTLIKIWLKIL